THFKIRPGSTAVVSAAAATTHAVRFAVARGKGFAVEGSRRSARVPGLGRRRRSATVWPPPVGAVRAEASITRTSGDSRAAAATTGDQERLPRTISFDEDEAAAAAAGA